MSMLLLFAMVARRKDLRSWGVPIRSRIPQALPDLPDDVVDDYEDLFSLPSLRGGFWRDQRTKEGIRKCFVVSQRQPGL